MILSNYRESMMMQFTLVILLVSVRGSLQIINGSIPKTDKPYMVYLLKSQSPRSPYHATQDPTGWTCGGVIIHPLYVLTSAICLADIELVYVISGYRKYVSADLIESDPCLLNMKKRIIAHCRLEMTDYDVNTFAKFYYQQPKWIVKDIATARVDTPFQFHDNSYLKFCSYKPSMIRVNYLRKYEAPGTVAMALGWGHTKYYRAVHDFKDYNSENLMYTPTVLLDREKCVQSFTPNEESELYKKSLKESSFCTYAPGTVDSDGVPMQLDELWNGNYNDTYKERNSIYYSWDRRSLRNDNNTQSNNSKNDAKAHQKQDHTIQKDANIRNMRRYILRVEPEKNGNGTVNKNKTENVTAGWEAAPWAMTGKPDLGPDYNGPGNGICQNDHGGPLVAWIGGHERVIGVATAFKVTKQMECKGPFLFVSTACANQLIMCTVNKKERRRSMGCDSFDLLRQGMRIVEKTVTWDGHPDAPKQIVEERNQEDYGFLDNWYGG